MSESATASEAHEVVLAEQLMIGNAGELQDALVDAASQGGSVVIDAGSVAQVHTSALQLLVAFTKHAEQWGIDVEWGEISQEMHAVADLAGLSDALGFPCLQTMTSQD